MNNSTLVNSGFSFFSISFSWVGFFLGVGAIIRDNDGGSFIWQIAELSNFCISSSYRIMSLRSGQKEKRARNELMISFDADRVSDFKLANS